MPIAKKNTDTVFSNDYHYDEQNPSADYLLFKNKIFGFLGIKTPTHIYIIHYNKKYKKEIKNHLFLFKSLNTKNLINSFYYFKNDIYHDLNRDIYLGAINRNTFIEINDKFSLETFSKLKIVLPKNDDCKLEVGSRNFNYIVFETIKLEDFSRIHLIKTIGLKHYFKKLLKNKEQEKTIISSLYENITNARHKTINYLTNNNYRNISWFVSMVNPRSSLFKLVNVYCYRTQTKNLLNLLNVISNAEINVDTDAKNLNNLLKMYYLSVIEKANENTLNPEKIPENIMDSDNLSKIYEHFLMKLKYKISDYPKELLNMIIENKFIEIKEYGLKIWIYQDLNYFTFSVTNSRVDIFNIKLWNANLDSLSSLLTIIDKKTVLYQLQDRLEQCILKIKNL